MSVIGCPDLMISVDHKPLTAIFADRALEKISNPRLLNFKEHSLMYRFKIKHTPGKRHVGPDATSRYPTSSSIASVSNVRPPLQNAVNQEIEEGIKSSLAASYDTDKHLQAITWDRVVAAAAQDEECQLLSQAISSGFPPSKNELPELIRRYWPVQDELYTICGVPLKDSRILIPRLLRAEVLECLHAAHQGVNGMLANARQRLFWLGLEANLRQTRAQGRGCNEMAPSQPREPMAEPPTPQFPFQHTVVDFCGISGNKYVIFADRYTGWVEAALMKDPTAKRVCDLMRAWYCTYGAPEEQASDGGPPF